MSTARPTKDEVAAYRKALHERQQARLEQLLPRLQELNRTFLPNELLQGQLISEEMELYAQEKVQEHEYSGSAKKRDTMVARFAYGLGRARAIAIEMGVSEGTVKNRYQLYRVARDFGGYDPQTQTLPRELDGLPADYFRKMYPYWLDFFGDGEKKLPPEKAKGHLIAAAEAKARGERDGDERYSADRMLLDVVRDVGHVDTRREGEDKKETDTRPADFLEALRETIRAGKDLAPDKGYEVFTTPTAHVIHELMEMTNAFHSKGEERALSILKSVRPVRGLRGVHYVGSKAKETKVTFWELARNIPIDKVTKVADVFAGRSHVGHFFKQHGCEVTSNDILAWAAGWARWVVGLDTPPLTEQEVRDLIVPMPVEETTRYSWVAEEFVWRHEGTLPKLSPQNAALAASYLTRVDSLPPEKRDMARILLAITIHDHLPFSGNEKNFVPEELEYILEDELIRRLHLYNQMQVQGRPCQVTNLNAIQFLYDHQGAFDLLYMDPPYAVPRVLYDSRLVESIARGRLFGKAEFDRTFQFPETAVEGLSRLFEAADRAAPYWAVAYNSTSEVTPWEIGRLISPWRAQLHFAISHRMSIATIPGVNRQQTDEFVIVCMPYEESVRDERILSTVRTPSTEVQAGPSWLTPGYFSDDSRPRMQVTFLKDEHAMVRCLDDHPACSELVDFVEDILAERAPERPPAGIKGMNIQFLEMDGTRSVLNLDFPEDGVQAA